MSAALSGSKVGRLVDNVLRMPGLQDIPDPELPLSGVSEDKYFQICARLLRTNRLTMGTRGLAEQLAIQVANQHRLLLKNKLIPAHMTAQVLRLQEALALIDDESPVGKSNPDAAKTGFEHVGFPNRASSAKRFR